MILQIVIKKKPHYCKENSFKSALINPSFENHKMSYHDNPATVCTNVSPTSKGAPLSAILFLAITNRFKRKNI